MPRETLIPAVYAILQRDRDVLLARRCNTGYQDGKYGLIAGHIEKGETLTDALIRESREEAGIEISASGVELAHVMHRPAEGYVDFFFYVREWTGTPEILEPEKCDDLAWYAVADLPESTIAYVRAALQRTGDGILYSEFSSG